MADAKERLVTTLPAVLERRLIVVRGRSGLLYEQFNPGIVENQEGHGRGIDDYVAMTIAHGNIYVDAKILGVNEEMRDRVSIIIDGLDLEYLSANPFIRNMWVGRDTKLYTLEVAAKIPYAGKTALEWATINRQTPEAVVKANNGYFYPATKFDMVIDPSHPSRLISA